MQTVYLISGPLGVGKTTTTRALAKKVKGTKLVEGDVLLHALNKNESLTWEEKLKLSWKKILSLTQTHLKKGSNVAIDFVVEEELAWFCKQIAGNDVVIKYVVLMTNKDNIVKRLRQRKELKYLDRSLVLLKKLKASSENVRHFYDNTRKKVPDVVADIITSKRFIVKNTGK